MFREAWAGETTESMGASLSSLSRCAGAASAFDPVTPSPPEDKPRRLVPHVTPDDAVRQNLMLDEDLAWATA